MIALGIDAGGSSTRWLLRNETQVLARGRTDSITGHLITAVQQETLAKLTNMFSDICKVAQPQSVVAGITGLSASPDAPEWFREHIAQLLDIQTQQVKIYDDIYIAYLTAFEPEEGILIYAGTGSVAVYLKRDGSRLRAGGFGYLIDDAGGGFWIGREGLKQVLRWADETDTLPQQPLAKAIYEALGTKTWTDISTLVYTGGRSKVAALAPAVALAAVGGDNAALSILQEAGRELAQLAKTLINRLDRPLPIALLGGISSLSPVLVAGLGAALPSDVKFRVISVEPVETAARLALENLQTAP
jgi:glucosamine kinase